MHTFTAVAQNGQLEFTDPKRLQQFLIMNSGELVVTVGKRRKIRSDKQNRYFYGQVVRIISEHTGHTDKEIKDYLKQEFGWTKVIEIAGKAKTVLRSTADMDTGEFEKFMSQIRMWADLQGYYIPAPNEPIR